MSGGYFTTGKETIEYTVTLTITGDVESLRPRLGNAVQKLGYTVVEEQPLYARRGGKGGARWDCSFEALDYPTRLNVSLKQVNNVAVVASFNYEVQSDKHLTKGDRQTLVREAQAIAAVAREQLSISTCPSCATPVVDDSHFCRRCGAPLAVEVAELEVFRLTRNSRRAYHNLVTGLLMFCVASLLFVPLFWVDGKAFKALLTFASMFGVFGLGALLQGIWQVHFALNPRSSQKAVAQPAIAIAAALTQALPAPAVHASITEGTTELLVSNIENNERRAAEPIPRKALDTGEVDDERLM